MAQETLEQQLPFLVADRLNRLYGTALAFTIKENEGWKGTRFGVLLWQRDLPHDEGKEFIVHTANCTTGEFFGGIYHRNDEPAARRAYAKRGGK